MTAEEMFEKLGYKKERFLPITNAIQYEKIMEDGHSYIEFNINYKSVCAFFINNKYTEYSESITIEELKAINQKYIELGWFDD